MGIVDNDRWMPDHWYTLSFGSGELKSNTYFSSSKIWHKRLPTCEAWTFPFLFHFLMKFVKANRIAPDGMPCFAVSHLALFCLPMLHKKDAMVISFNKMAGCERKKTT